MWKILFIASFALLLPISSQADDSGSSYDWRSGNRYSWDTDSSGETRVRGSNSRTGSRWNTTIDPDGDMKGSDSDGNRWRYNSNTGSYYNYGTGQSCRGSGRARTCW